MKHTILSFALVACASAPTPVVTPETVVAPDGPLGPDGMGNPDGPSSPDVAPPAPGDIEGFGECAWLQVVGEPGPARHGGPARRVRQSGDGARSVRRGRWLGRRVIRPMGARGRVHGQQQEATSTAVATAASCSMRSPAALRSSSRRRATSRRRTDRHLLGPRHRADGAQAEAVGEPGPMARAPAYVSRVARARRRDRTRRRVRAEGQAGWREHQVARFEAPAARDADVAVRVYPEAPRLSPDGRALALRVTIQEGQSLVPRSGSCPSEACAEAPAHALSISRRARAEGV